MPVKKSKTKNAVKADKTVKKLVNQLVQECPKWSINAAENQLKRELKIENYVDGLTVLARVVVHAELMGHHPEIIMSYQKIVFKLTTHSAGTITKLDTDLARQIEKIIQDRL